MKGSYLLVRIATATSIVMDSSLGGRGFPVYHMTKLLIILGFALQDICIDAVLLNSVMIRSI